jgi:NADH-quinone oxidoreductase subunit H
MSTPFNIVFWIAVIPVTVVIGLVASWIVRKVSALVQWRVGPPLLQPFYDVVKLVSKEIVVPQESQQTVFIMAPLVGMAGVFVLSIMLWYTAIAQQAFLGDIIVAIYLMVLPSLALILGSSASASPHATVGTSREMKLVLGYELPLVLGFVVVLIKSAGSINLAEIAALERAPGFSISGLIAFLVSLLCIHAKIGYVPFDMAEAETELASGVLMEYSGALLAIWQIMQATMLVALPMFLVTVFLGGFGPGLGGWLSGIGWYVLVLVLIILIKNTNPRVRIDQAMKFFWVYCFIAMVAAIVLAMIGSRYGIAWL